MNSRAVSIQIQLGDITTYRVDAIVNASNERLAGGGGVDGAIHRAAGPGLLEECLSLRGCPTGEARVTKSYRLPCKWVIHTVGPIWRGGGSGEAKALTSCYRRSLDLAESLDCRTIAFPAISCGIYGYPLIQAAKIALSTLVAFEPRSLEAIYCVCFDKQMVEVYLGVYTGKII